MGTISEAFGALAKLPKLEIMRLLVGLSVLWRKGTLSQGRGHFPGVSRGAGQPAERTLTAAWVPQDQPPRRRSAQLSDGSVSSVGTSGNGLMYCPPLRAEPTRQKETHPGKSRVVHLQLPPTGGFIGQGAGSAVLH